VFSSCTCGPSGERYLATPKLLRYNSQNRFHPSINPALGARLDRSTAVLLYCNTALNPKRSSATDTAQGVSLGLALDFLGRAG